MSVSKHNMSDTVIISEVEEDFKDKWLAFEVLEKDAKGFPFKGKLIAHNTRRKPVYEALLQMRPEISYIAYTGEKPRKGIVSVL